MLLVTNNYLRALSYLNSLSSLGDAFPVNMHGQIFSSKHYFRTFNIFMLLLFFCNIYVAVNFSSQVIFLFLFFFGMVMYANEVETKEK